MQEVTEIIGKMLDEVPPTTQLATAYAYLSGERGEFVNLWARDAGDMEMSWQTGAPASSEYEDLYRLVDYETIDYINPLPYSKLR